ncbi:MULTISPECIES: chemotaxis protein CheD [Bacillus]|uniref:chemotaxis protein CheD n=1 Tax=Bacillus TaxID=1386 RepID=UPI000BB68031|nr:MULTISPECIES: chemotaxis protein CheD [Bacillus]
MITLEKIIKVGIAEANIVTPPKIIRTSGLGSCVGLVLFDIKKQVAGMVHVMLPESSLARTEGINKCKYADTGVEFLLETLLMNGASRRNLQAKMAGGAEMFRFSSTNDTLRIGPRNVQAVKERLRSFQIPLVSEDCGGNSGRTIEFDPSTGKLMIKTVNKGIHYI